MPVYSGFHHLVHAAVCRKLLVLHAMSLHSDCPFLDSTCTNPPRPFNVAVHPPQVYDWNSNQKEIFDITARPIIDAVMDGYNGGNFD